MNIAKILKISIASLFIGIIHCQYILCMDGKWEHTNKINKYNKKHNTIKKLNDYHRIHETRNLNAINDDKTRTLNKIDDFPLCTTELPVKLHTLHTTQQDTPNKPMILNKMNDVHKIGKINHRYNSYKKKLEKLEEMHYRDQFRKEMEESKREYYHQMALHRAELEAEIYRYELLIAFEKYRAKK